MPAQLTICAKCEQHILRRPRQGKAMSEALACLTRLLLKRRQLKGLVVLREDCLQNCPMGKLCVALTCAGKQRQHHLGTSDDLAEVVLRLTGEDQPKAPAKGPS
jgi:hypothetical protein